MLKHNVFDFIAYFNKDIVQIVLCNLDNVLDFQLYVNSNINKIF